MPAAPYWACWRRRSCSARRCRGSQARAVGWRHGADWPRLCQHLFGGNSMTRSRHGIAATLGVLAASWAGAAAAETAYSAEGGTDSFLKLLIERLEFTVQQIPALGRHLANLPDIIDGRTTLLLLGIVVAGLAAEYAVRLLLNRARLKGFDRLVGHSPLRAFGRAFLLDLAALIALAVAGRLVLAQIGDPQSVGGRLGQEILQAVLYWRSFNLVFRAWLRPAAPEGRIAPVDTD